MAEQGNPLFSGQTSPGGRRPPGKIAALAARFEQMGGGSSDSSTSPTKLQPPRVSLHEASKPESPSSPSVPSQAIDYEENVSDDEVEVEQAEEAVAAAEQKSQLLDLNEDRDGERDMLPSQLGSSVAVDFNDDMSPMRSVQEQRQMVASGLRTPDLMDLDNEGEGLGGTLSGATSTGLGRFGEEMSPMRVPTEVAGGLMDLDAGDDDLGDDMSDTVENFGDDMSPLKVQTEAIQEPGHQERRTRSESLVDLDEVEELLADLSPGATGALDSSLDVGLGRRSFALGSEPSGQGELGAEDEIIFYEDEADFEVYDEEEDEDLDLDGELRSTASHLPYANPVYDRGQGGHGDEEYFVDDFNDEVVNLDELEGRVEEGSYMRMGGNTDEVDGGVRGRGAEVRTMLAATGDEEFDVSEEEEESSSVQGLATAAAYADEEFDIENEDVADLDAFAPDGKPQDDRASAVMDLGNEDEFGKGADEDGEVLDTSINHTYRPAGIESDVEEGIETADLQSPETGASQSPQFDATFTNEVSRVRLTPEYLEERAGERPQPPEQRKLDFDDDAGSTSVNAIAEELPHGVGSENRKHLLDNRSDDASWERSAGDVEGGSTDLKPPYPDEPGYDSAEDGYSTDKDEPTKQSHVGGDSQRGDAGVVSSSILDDEQSFGKTVEEDAEDNMEVQTAGEETGTQPGATNEKETSGAAAREAEVAGNTGEQVAEMPSVFTEGGNSSDERIVFGSDSADADVQRITREDEATSQFVEDEAELERMAVEEDEADLLRAVADDEEAELLRAVAQEEDDAAAILQETMVRDGDKDENTANGAVDDGNVLDSHVNAASGGRQEAQLHSVAAELGGSRSFDAPESDDLLAEESSASVGAAPPAEKEDVDIQRTAGPVTMEGGVGEVSAAEKGATSAYSDDGAEIQRVAAEEEFELLRIASEEDATSVAEEESVTNVAVEDEPANAPSQLQDTERAHADAEAEEAEFPSISVEEEDPAARTAEAARAQRISKDEHSVDIASAAEEVAPSSSGHVKDDTLSIEREEAAPSREASEEGQVFKAFDRPSGSTMPLESGAETRGQNDTGIAENSSKQQLEEGKGGWPVAGLPETALASSEEMQHAGDHSLDKRGGLRFADALQQPSTPLSPIRTPRKSFNTEFESKKGVSFTQEAEHAGQEKPNMKPGTPFARLGSTFDDAYEDDEEVEDSDSASGEESLTPLVETQSVQRISRNGGGVHFAPDADEAGEEKPNMKPGTPFARLGSTFDELYEDDEEDSDSDAAAAEDPVVMPMRTLSQDRMSRNGTSPGVHFTPDADNAGQEKPTMKPGTPFARLGSTFDELYQDDEESESDDSKGDDPVETSSRTHSQEGMRQNGISHGVHFTPDAEKAGHEKPNMKPGTPYARLGSTFDELYEDEDDEEEEEEVEGGDNVHVSGQNIDEEEQKEQTSFAVHEDSSSQPEQQEIMGVEEAMQELRTLSFSLSPIKTPRAGVEGTEQKKAAVKFTPAAVAAGKEKPNMKAGTPFARLGATFDDMYEDDEESDASVDGERPTTPKRIVLAGEISEKKGGVHFSQSSFSAGEEKPIMKPGTPFARLGSTFDELYEDDEEESNSDASNKEDEELLVEGRTNSAVKFTAATGQMENDKCTLVPGTPFARLGSTFDDLYEDHETSEEEEEEEEGKEGDGRDGDRSQQQREEVVPVVREGPFEAVAGGLVSKELEQPSTPLTPIRTPRTSADATERRKSGVQFTAEAGQAGEEKPNMKPGTPFARLGSTFDELYEDEDEEADSDASNLDDKELVVEGRTNSAVKFVEATGKAENDKCTLVPGTPFARLGSTFDDLYEDDETSEEEEEEAVGGVEKSELKSMEGTSPSCGNGNVIRGVDNQPEFRDNLDQPSTPLTPVRTPRVSTDPAGERKSGVKFTPEAAKAGEEKPNMKPGTPFARLGSTFDELYEDDEEEDDSDASGKEGEELVVEGRTNSAVKFVEATGKLENDKCTLVPGTPYARLGSTFDDLYEDDETSEEEEEEVAAAGRQDSGERQQQLEEAVPVVREGPFEAVVGGRVSKELEQPSTPLTPIRTPKASADATERRKSGVQFAQEAVEAGEEKPNMKPGTPFARLGSTFDELYEDEEECSSDEEERGKREEEIEAEAEEEGRSETEELYGRKELDISSSFDETLAAASSPTAAFSSANAAVRTASTGVEQADAESALTRGADVSEAEAEGSAPTQGGGEEGENRPRLTWELLHPGQPQPDQTVARRKAGGGAGGVSGGGGLRWSAARLGEGENEGVFEEHYEEMLEDAVADGDSDATPGGPRAPSSKTVARVEEWHALNERVETRESEHAVATMSGSRGDPPPGWQPRPADALEKALTETLQRFSVAVLKEQPGDVLRFAANYFAAAAVEKQ